MSLKSLIEKMDEINALSEATEETPTGKIHKAGPGGYGRKIDTDEEGEEKKSEQPAVKRGRGRPKKGSDSETGEEKKWDFTGLLRPVKLKDPTGKETKRTTVTKMSDAEKAEAKKEKEEEKKKEGKKRSLKDWMEHVESEVLNEAVPPGMKPLIVLDPANKQAGLGVISSSNPTIQTTIQKMLGGLDPKDAKIVMTPSTQSGQTSTTQTTGISTAQPSTGTTPMKEEEVDEVTMTAIHRAKEKRLRAKYDSSDMKASMKKQYGPEKGEDVYFSTIRKQAMKESKKSISESYTLEDVLSRFPHERKACDEGWGMHEGLYEALADHYFKEGRIPHKVWHGPLEELRDWVEECYMKDTQKLNENPALIAAATRVIPGAINAAATGFGMGVADKLLTNNEVEEEKKLPLVKPSDRFSDELPPEIPLDPSEIDPSMSDVEIPTFVRKSWEKGERPTLPENYLDEEILDEMDYAVEEMENTMSENKKWIQKAIKHPGALKKQLGVPADEKIPASKLEKAAHAGGKLGQRARLAQTLKGLKKESISEEQRIMETTSYQPSMDFTKQALSSGIAQKVVSRHSEQDPTLYTFKLYLIPVFSPAGLKSAEVGLLASGTKPIISMVIAKIDNNFNFIFRDEDSSKLADKREIAPGVTRTSTRSEIIFTPAQKELIKKAAKILLSPAINNQTEKQKQLSNQGVAEGSEDYDINSNFMVKRWAEVALEKNPTFTIKDKDKILKIAYEYAKEHAPGFVDQIWKPEAVLKAYFYMQNRNKPQGELNPDVKLKVKQQMLKVYGPGKVTFTYHNYHNYVQHEDKFGDTNSDEFDPKTGKVKFDDGSVSSTYYGEGVTEGSEPVNKKNILRTYRRNENNNNHSENAVLLAKHFGTPEELKKAQDAVKYRNKEGGYSMSDPKAKAFLDFTVKIHEKYYPELTKKDKKDPQMESWELELKNLLTEGMTITTSTGQPGGMDSVSISATDEDAKTLMQLLQRSGISQGVSGGIKTASVHHDDEPAVTVEPVSSDEVMGTLEPEKDDRGDTALSFLKRMIGARHFSGSCENVEEMHNETASSGDAHMSPIPEEEEMEEGNAFTGALAKARKDGVQPGETITVGGKKYPVKKAEDMNEEALEQPATMEDDDWKDAGSQDIASAMAQKANDEEDAKTEKEIAMSEDEETCNECGMYESKCDCDHEKLDESRMKEWLHHQAETMDREAFIENATEMGMSDEAAGSFWDKVNGSEEDEIEKLDEWANSPQNKLEDEQFTTEMEFMTKTLSGGLNKIKQDQTVMPSARVVTAGEHAEPKFSMAEMLKKLNNIN